MIYRKRGVVARWENGTHVRVTENGIAIEEGELFECRPAEPEPARVPSVEPIQVPPLHLPDGVSVERLLLTHGVAEHEYGDTRWREESRRLHLSMVCGRMRVLIDQADWDTTHIEQVARGLAAAETSEREPPPRLRLAPNVTAAILPILAGIAPPNVRLLQTAGGIDGYGEPIVEAEHDWPNFYRPSYRVRPVRMPFNLRLECDVTQLDEERPRAIALLAPAHATTIKVLVQEQSCVYPATVRITRIDAVARERVWYPYGAGSFGAEMML